MKDELATRKHIHEEKFAVKPENMFEILHTPSAICSWWGAARAIVLAEENGVWTAAWGENADEPDHISSFVIKHFERPKRMFLNEAKYFAKKGKLPFDAKMTTEFIVEPTENGCILRVIQDGFPCDPTADDFYAACDTGWRNTFAGIRKFVEESDS
jgi:uncharacterized protein YndB with AHSA1/START domain